MSAAVVGAFMVAVPLPQTGLLAGAPGEGAAPERQIASAPEGEAAPADVIEPPGKVAQRVLADASGGQAEGQADRLVASAVVADEPAEKATPRAADQDPQPTAIVTARSTDQDLTRQTGAGPIRPDPSTAWVTSSLGASLTTPRRPESYRPAGVTAPSAINEQPVMIEVPAPRLGSAASITRAVAEDLNDGAVPSAGDDVIVRSQIASADVANAPAAAPVLPSDETFALALEGPAVQVSAPAKNALREAPLIAVVLSDAGGSELTEDMLNAVSLPLTIGIVPGSERDAELAAMARATGFEVLAQIPFATRADGSRDSLVTGMSPDEVEDVTDRLVAKLPAAVAVSNFQSDRASRNEKLMRSLIQALDARGLAYVERRFGPGSTAAQLAGDLGAAYAASTRIIPPEASADNIYRSLNGAAREAQLRGAVIVMGPANRTMLEAMVRWGLERGGRAATLVPVSEVLARSRG